MPYKRIDLIAEAFALMPGRRLIIVGEGAEHRRVLEATRGAPNITLSTAVSGAELVSLMQGARAFVFAAEEDYGISMVEVQACGTPVISFDRGGAADILYSAKGEEPTDVLYSEQTAFAIVKAVERFEAMSPMISPEACRINALRFTETTFCDQFDALIKKSFSERESMANVEFCMLEDAVG